VGAGTQYPGLEDCVDQKCGFDCGTELCSQANRHGAQPIGILELRLFLARKEFIDMPSFHNLGRIQTLKVAIQIIVSGGLFYVCIAQAESIDGLKERQRIYQIERQRCLTGHTGQTQTSCLQEAGAVLQQSHRLEDQVNAKQLAENALQRCNAFQGDERQSCIDRMQGHGSVQGSAASGGILRELTEPAQ
jgi:hypothetical protein